MGKKVRNASGGGVCTAAKELVARGEMRRHRMMKEKGGPEGRKNIDVLLSVKKNDLRGQTCSEG